MATSISNPNINFTPGKPGGGPVAIGKPGGGQTVFGTFGADKITGTQFGDTIFGNAGNDQISAGAGADEITGGAGDDSILGGDGDDTAIFNVTVDGSDQVDLGAGNDQVQVSTLVPTQIRLTFTSAEVGNGTASDANKLANQDGGLAVRLQMEDRAGNLTGAVSRYDDEGISFVGGQGIKFDVRDLVSGVQRGDMFDEVELGTSGNDLLKADSNTRNYYFNAGMGNDTIVGGNANDFLVGGAGNDILDGGLGNDSFIGGGGNDQLTGGLGNDLAIFNVTTDGLDLVDLGAGNDTVAVGATTPTQIRLTFTSAEVGNGNAKDGGALLNQDGGLALRFQAEDGAGNLVGSISRYDDEGITFEAGVGVTFDVRDLVSGAARGDQFQEVALGTSGADKMTVDDAGRSYYFNAGAGNDTITGGNVNDFLVGGAGNDSLSGRTGNDSFIGGGGNDVMTGGTGSDFFIFAAALDARLNIETITDFQPNVDVLRLDDAFFAGLPLGALATGAFALSTAPGQADDRIIYEQASGKLYFDANGGSRSDAIQFAELTNRPAGLDAGDFFVI